MSHTEKARRVRPVWLLTALCLFMLALPIALTAWPRSAPASMRAQAEPTPTTAPVASATATGVITGTTPVTATEIITATATPAGTPAPLPTPTGAPPADPYANLTIFGFLSAGNLVAKSDRLPLDGTPVDNVLLTSTEARLGVLRPITEEVTSALGVASWDPVYFRWDLAWQSEAVSGTARLLAAATQPGGWNGGTLLGTADRVIALRTNTLDGAAHLHLFKWNKDTHQGEPLRMAPVGDGPEREAVFDADLDVNMADLNDDGVWEVIADNVTGVQVWRWDGSKYVPVEGR